MADDQLDVTTGETETPSFPSEEQTTQVEETQEVSTETESQPEHEESTLSEFPEVKSDKGINRVQELANENKRLKEQLAKQSVRPHEQYIGAFNAANQPEVTPYPQVTTGLPWDPNAEEVTPEDYQRNVMQTADSIVQARVADVEFRLRKEQEIKEDYNEIERKFEELNPNSASYNEELSNNIAELYKVQLKADKKTRLSDFVGKIMGIRQGGHEQGKAQVTARLIEQKAEEAVTSSPEASDIDNVDVDAMFKDPSRIEEQEAYLKKHGQWGND